MKVELLATADELNDLLAEPRAPVDQDRSFFVCDKSTYPRDAELPVLLDPLTGLPYPLLPADNELPINDPTVANWHHGFHPRGHPELATIGGKALRTAQIQLVRRDRHNHTKGAFHIFQVGPWIHREVGHQMGAALVAAAGVSHRMGLVTRDGELWLQAMNAGQVARLQIQAAPAEIATNDVSLYRERMGVSTEVSDKDIYGLLERQRKRDAMSSYRNLRTGYEQTRDLLIAYVLSQDLSNVKRKAKNKFIRSGDESLGHKLLIAAAAELVRDVVTYNGQTLHDHYANLYAAGMFNPNMPPTAAELVKHKLGSAEKRISLLPKFREELIRQQEAA